MVQTMTQELPNEVKQQIIAQQIAEWTAARYSLQLQYRVQVGLESKEGQANIEKRLLDCEKAFDILQGELDALELPA
jgi:hypothetical protein